MHRSRDTVGRRSEIFFGHDIKTIYLPGIFRQEGNDHMSDVEHSIGSSGPLRLKRLDPGLPVPARAHPADAGIDLFSAEDCELAPGQRALVGTGVAVAIPAGYVGLVHPRSGLAARAGLSIVNAPGTIDADYRGEIKVNLINLDTSEPVRIGRGERIAQLLIQRVELWDVLEVDELDQTERGGGGHGSTGGHHRLT